MKKTSSSITMATVSAFIAIILGIVNLADKFNELQDRVVVLKVRSDDLEQRLKEVNEKLLSHDLYMQSTREELIKSKCRLQ